MRESELKQLVVEYARLRGWRVMDMAMAKPRRPVKHATGYPDLTLARNRRVVFLELKQEAGTLSIDQLGWMHELPECYVIRPSDWHTGMVRTLLA